MLFGLEQVPIYSHLSDLLKMIVNLNQFGLNVVNQPSVPSPLIPYSARYFRRLVELGEVMLCKYLLFH